MIIETNVRTKLKAQAADLKEHHTGRSARDVLEDLHKSTFEGRIGLVSSFGTEAAILLHMMSRIDPEIPIIFLDTLKHFPETLEYRDSLIDELGLLNVQTVAPHSDALKADDPDGFLHVRNPDLCCHVRKSVPMLKSLRNLSCWITGRKRQQAATRSSLELFEVQDRWIKVNPLIDWTSAEVDEYFEKYRLTRHPLQAKGYPSIGCSVCTKPVATGEDLRAGRWADRDKTECGIHFVNGQISRTASPKD